MRITCLIGPTGSGKGKLAFNLSKELGFSIVLCDSRKVYKYMDIGTNKPLPEWRSMVNYYMIDIKYPDEFYSAGDYARDATRVIQNLVHRGEKFIVVGGGTLYLKALFGGLFKAPPPDKELREELNNRIKNEGLESLYQELKEVDPESAKRISNSDRVRTLRAMEIYYQTGKPLSFLQKENKKNPLFKPRFIGISMHRDALFKRVEERVDKMMERGFLKEVKELLNRGYSLRDKALNSHGYKDLILYLQGKLTLEQAISLTKRRTKLYTKRQINFFKNYLNNGVEWMTVEKKKYIFNKFAYLTGKEQFNE